MELIGAAEARSAAAPATVWERLIDGRRWSLWSPESEWMVVDSTFEPGNFVTIKRKRSRQTAYRITAALPPAKLALELTFGSAAQLLITWTLAPDGTGTSIRQTIESGGPFRRFLSNPLARRAAAKLAGDPARLAALAAGP